ncbi:MAG: CDP-alcohol phosphatidyltransferase family protein [Candidatus Omnitrophica bacterium]|nr:CDP-alcohol phosphatidyltransferase family protein [Candidatus Omnitrophota bacterium]
MSLTLANKITICRILAVPFLIGIVLYYSPEKDHLRYWALGIFVLAAGLDFFDGYFARTRNEKTRAGAILDPLADKLLLISAFICLYKVGVDFPVVRFPIWLVVAVISRDIILLTGSLLLYMVHRRLPMEATTWGKVSTFLQVLVVIGMFLQWKISVYVWPMVLVFVLISVVDYIRKGIKMING